MRRIPSSASWIGPRNRQSTAHLNLPEQIPQISLGTAALLIFGAIASLAVLRGLLRIFWGSLAFCLAGIAAFAVWQNSAAWSEHWLGHPVEWFSVAGPFVAFLLVLLILRIIIRFVGRPWGTTNDQIAERNRSSPLRWAFTLLFSLIPAGLLWFTGATMLRHVGSVAEIRGFAEKLAREPVSDRTAFLTRIKHDLDQMIPAAWFDAVDPFADKARVTLAKLLSLDGPVPPKAVPVLEEPAIRQLITSDPGLRQLAREGRYAEILRDPRLDKILENPDLRQVLQGLEL